MYFNQCRISSIKCTVVHAAFCPPNHSREQEHAHAHNGKHLEATILYFFAPCPSNAASVVWNRRQKTPFRKPKALFLAITPFRKQASRKKTHPTQPKRTPKNPQNFFSLRNLQWMMNLGSPFLGILMIIWRIQMHLG